MSAIINNRKQMYFKKSQTVNTEGAEDQPHTSDTITIVVHCKLL